MRDSIPAHLQSTFQYATREITNDSRKEACIRDFRFNSLVHVIGSTVGVAECAAGNAEHLFDSLLTSGDLVMQLSFWNSCQARMRTRVRPNFDTSLGQLLELLPVRRGV